MLPRKSRGEAVIPGAQSDLLYLILLLLAVSIACDRRPQAFGVYAPDTRELVRLDYDSNGDGVIDARTYMRDGRPVRLEVDGDGDGRIDRWEYYDQSGQLRRVGDSSQRDGREDTWMSTVGNDTWIDRSTRRDGVVDRRERYRGETLIATETDTNHDGLPDAWEQFEGGALRVLLLDDEQRSGRPTRRIVYEPGGARIEVDPDGDGIFTPDHS